MEARDLTKEENEWVGAEDREMATAVKKISIHKCVGESLNNTQDNLEQYNITESAVV